MNDLPQIYLASSSPRRQEILQQMGVSFELVPQFVEEDVLAGESAEQFVSRLAMEKAQAGMLQRKNQQIPVLGSDTIVVLNDKILGKPKNKQQSIEMLLSLSGKTHQVMTAIALINEARQDVKKQLSLCVSEVTFTHLSQELCESYWHTNEPIDKAGSYAIQGRAALFIKNINGSYSGVMGLPIYETSVLLHGFGIHLL